MSFRSYFQFVLVCMGVGAQCHAQPVSVQNPTSSADLYAAFFELETRYSSWSGSRGSNVFDPAPGRGTQVYTPMTLGLNYERPGAVRLETRVKGGYVSSNHKTAGQQASIDTLVDTQVTSTLTFLNNENFRTFVGVAVNLPTGESFLPGNTRFTRMDPDLVEVGSYGAGLNVNPTAGITFATTENTAVSVSAGYAWRGSFDRETLDPNSIPPCGAAVVDCPPVTAGFDKVARIDPGDVVTANFNTSTILENFSVKSSFAYMSEAYLKQDGVPIGKTGDKYVSNVTAVYVIDRHWKVGVNASWAFSRRNKVPEFGRGTPFNVVVNNTLPTVLGDIGPLNWETKNSNSHVLIGAIEPVYTISENMAVSVNYSVLWRSENYYDFIEEQFIPAKIKHSVGGAWTYILSPRSSIGLRGSYFWVEVDEGPLLGTRNPTLIQDNQHYRGWTAALKGNVQF